MPTSHPLPLILPLLKLKVVSDPENDWRWAECSLCLFPWHVPSHIINLLLSPFTNGEGIYLAYRGEGPDLICGSPGVLICGLASKPLLSCPPSRGASLTQFFLSVSPQSYVNTSSAVPSLLAGRS
jgi:hypothetical protein